MRSFAQEPSQERARRGVAGPVHGIHHYCALMARANTPALCEIQPFEPTLRRFQRQFEETDTEEGTVMATTLAYVIGNLRSSRRAAILDEFRTSGRILRLFQEGVRELRAALSGA